MQQEKPTLNQLLQRHNIAYYYFYENCYAVPTEDIATMYSHNMGVKSRIEKMLAFINDFAGTSYTIADIYIKKLF